ncbi:MAG: exodeoxyribonuclease VII large subunit, partial [Desulfobacteraceae bacterium]
EHRHRLDSNLFALNALNPKTILKRGYSITRKLPEKTVIMDSNQVSDKDLLEIILANGTLQVKKIP